MTGVDWLLGVLFVGLIATRFVDVARRPPGTSAWLVFMGKQGSGPGWYFWVVLGALVVVLAASPHRELLVRRPLGN